MSNDDFDNTFKLELHEFGRFTAFTLGNGVPLGYLSSHHRTGKDFELHLSAGAPEWIRSVKAAGPYETQNQAVAEITKAAERARRMNKLFDILDPTENDIVVNDYTASLRAMSGLLVVGMEGDPITIKGKRLMRACRVQEAINRGSITVWLGNGGEMPSPMDRHTMPSLTIAPEPNGWRVLAMEADTNQVTTIAFLRRGCAKPSSDAGTGQQ